MKELRLCNILIKTMVNYPVIMTSLLYVVMSFSLMIPCEAQEIQLIEQNGNQSSFDMEKHNQKIDSLSKIDYIDRYYEFLDRDFNIIIGNGEKEKFDAIYARFIKEVVEPMNYRIKPINFGYKDSLRIILYDEFGDDRAVHIAFHRILKKWGNIAFYIWDSPAKAQEIGNGFGYTHPHRFYKFLIDDEKKSVEKDQLLKQVQSKILTELEVAMPIEPNKTFLTFAFRKNPKRMEAMKAYIKKHSKE